MEKEAVKENSVMSVVLSPGEQGEVKELAEKLGISLSHLGRALIRLGIQSVSGVHDGAKDEMYLRLIKLGK
jgi:16S rRNA U516 pseudouridylate synthase RsuA-like enzyme